MVDLNDQIKSKREQLAAKESQLKIVEDLVSKKEVEKRKVAEQKQKLKNFHKEESLQKEKQDLEVFRNSKENAQLTDAVYNVIESLTQTEEQRKKNKEGAKNPAIYAGAALLTAVFAFILLGPLGVSANVLSLLIPIFVGLLGFAGNKVREDKNFETKEKSQKEELSQKEKDAINKTRDIEKNIDNEKANNLNKKNELNKEIDDLKNQINSDKKLLKDIDKVNDESKSKLSPESKSKSKSKLSPESEPDSEKGESKAVANSSKLDEMDENKTTKREDKYKVTSLAKKKFEKLVDGKIDYRYAEGKSKGAIKENEFITTVDGIVIYDTKKMANDIAELIILATGKELEGLSVGMIKTVIESRVTNPDEVNNGKLESFSEKDPYKNYRHYFKAIAEKVDNSIPHDGAKINSDITSEIREMKQSYELLKTGMLKDHNLIDSNGKPENSGAANKINEINEKVERKRESLGDVLYGNSVEAKKVRERI